MTHSLACHVCGDELCELAGFPVAIQVTSDCRLWKGSGRLATCSGCGTLQKNVTDDWLREMGNLYAGYSIYEQGGGREQVSFDEGSGAGIARSKKITDWLCATGSLAQDGALLDIGCGNGAFMRAFGEHRPHWHMTGLELDARNRASIEAIPGAVNLHVGTLESLDARFDLIVLVHALEHIPHPVQYLRGLSGRLNPGGMVLIEVPDLDRSPFDILIADHCTHFNAHTLRSIVNMGGFEILYIEAGRVAKELTLLARHPARTNDAAVAAPDEDGEVTAKRLLAWLERVLAQGQSIQAPVGIFGTSISATWLAGALGEKVKFFVDEDANRIGRQHMGLPIHSPQDAPADLAILMPLRADIAASVRARLSHTHLQFVGPPAG
jgi:2-polyprenyl-3-methyl-5-hydroxy-6-metoxy-1,4-benzoquinol methylase